MSLNENSLEWQASEFRKCRENFVYFCENYAKILHPSGGIIAFKLYNYQKRVSECYNKHKYNMIVKFRQGGISTETVVYLCWRCIFFSDRNTAMFVTKSDREAKNTGKIVDTLIENLPDWLKPRMNKHHAHDKIFLDSQGAIYFYTVKAARSRSVYYLVVDEAAFIQNMDECWADTFPTIAAGDGRCIVISTPNGMGNWYATEYHKALKNENNFNVIDIDVNEHPQYSKPDWLEEQRKQLGEKRFGQEVLKRFLAPGDTWLSLKIISNLDLMTRQTPPKFKRFPHWDSSKDDTRGSLWVWKPPVEGREYIVAADTGEGVGEEGDYSAFQILDIADSEQVSEFYSNIIPPFDFANLLNEVCLAYNQALLVVEKKGPGVATLEQLERRLFYPHLFGEKKGGTIKFRKGFDTNASARTAIFDVLNAALLNQTVKINSSRLVKEFNTFIFNTIKKRPEAGGKGNHDDLILSLAIALKIRNDVYVNVQNYTQAVEQPKNIFEQNTRDIIRQELEGMFLNNDPQIDLPYIYDSPFGEELNLGKEAWLNRPGHDILLEFGL